jgi:hypothetical protein
LDPLKKRILLDEKPLEMRYGVEGGSTGRPIRSNTPSSNYFFSKDTPTPPEEHQQGAEESI